MKRPMMAIKGCDKMTSNDTYFPDIWFSGVKTAEEVMAEEVDSSRLLKTINKSFCLATL